MLSVCTWLNKTNLGHVGEDTFKAATAMAGGIAASGNTCGACTGAILAISSFLGRVLKTSVHLRALQIKIK